MLVAGNTAKGITSTPTTINTFVDISLVPEMHIIEQNVFVLSIGSLVTLSETIAALTKAATVNGFEYVLLYVEHLEKIANLQVRNVMI